MQLWTSPLPLRLVTVSPVYRPQIKPQHRHPFYELALVQEGQCTWHLGARGERVTIGTGEALLLPPRMAHAEEVSAGQKATIAWVGFDFDGPAPRWCGRPILLGDDTLEITGYFEAIAREHHHADARSQTRISLALQSLLLLLERCAEGVLELAPSRSGLNPRQRHAVESAAHYFTNNLQNPLSISQVAAYHSLCLGHFSTLFRQQHRITPRGFLRRARLQKAGDLLAGTEMSIKEIATQCGFVDAAHLCKSFKKERRLTPGGFRTKVRRQS